MHNSDYYREQAAKYRELAEGTKNATAKQEFLELASACVEALPLDQAAAILGEKDKRRRLAIYRNA